MKKSLTVFLFFISMQVLAQKSCCGRQDLEQYAIDVLSKDSHRFKINNSNDMAGFLGFHFKGGYLDSSALFGLDSLFHIRQEILPFKETRRFGSYINSHVKSATYTGWVMLPVLFKHTTSEDDPKTIPYSQHIYQYLMTGISKLSMKFDGVIFLPHFTTVYGATYY